MLLAGKPAVHTVHPEASISLRSLSTLLNSPFSLSLSVATVSMDRLSFFSFNVMLLLAAVSALLLSISSYSAFLHRHWRRCWGFNSIGRRPLFASFKTQKTTFLTKFRFLPRLFFPLLCSLFMLPSCMPSSLVRSFLSGRRMGGGRVCLYIVYSCIEIRSRSGSFKNQIALFFLFCFSLYILAYLTSLLFSENRFSSSCT